jgi:penicillin G amidase
MKKLKRVLIILLFCILLVILGTFIYLKLTLPKTTGTISVEKISNEINIKRNQWGVPLIEAQSIEDMFFAIGYCHASDRLFQMDLSRRLAKGKLSEVFGKRAIRADKYRKGLMIEESIEKSLALVPEEVKKIMEQYCNGVNFFIKSQTLPPEFTLLRYKPEPWTASDTMAVLKNMEAILADSGSELYNMKVVQALGMEKAQAFISGVYGLPIINRKEYDELFENKELETAYLHERDILENGIGSNNWVISGKKTQSGFPILSNDPHLGTTFPSFFYQLNAKSGDIELLGNMLPGVPFIIIGRNNHIGWGFTNVGSDVIDYFKLKLNPQNKNQYQWDGEWLDFDIIEKKIKVKGDTDVIHKIKVSRLGPVHEENGETFARHSIGQYPSDSPKAFYLMNFATNTDEFIKGLKRFTVPAQNAVFADTKGNIGYFPSGWLPKRRKGTGALPVIATGKADTWDGFYDEDEKPYLLNPAKGFVVTANNAVLPDSLLPIFSQKTYPSFRADRIDQLIREKEKLSVTDNMNIQLDSYLKGAEFIITRIKDFSFESKGAKTVLDHLKQWNFKSDKGILPYLFYRFHHHLSHFVFADDLKESGNRSLISRNWIYKIMNYPKQKEMDSFADFVDDKNTPAKENFKTIVKKSLEATYADYLKESQNGEPVWLKLHTVSYRHPLGTIPVIGSFLNEGPFAMQGGRDCVLTASFRGEEDFRISHLASFRMVMDFSDFSKSQIINASGQSGHFMSRHYDDQIHLYVDLKYRKMENFSQNLKILKLIPKH